ncbi:MAG TPA: oligosaccharide flippase family protein [Thermoanaerobaculaceae bacterium]|nr:oligosaccharide flippase family protein [Thermoanaerobaculaceae bacterium]
MSLKSSLYSVLPDFALGYAERIEASPIGYRLARGAFWSLAGAVISRGLTLLASILVARILGKVGFGELGIIQSTVGMFATFAGFGLGLTATKYLAEFKQKDPPRAGRILALSTSVTVATGAIAALVFLALAPWLASRTLAAPQLTGLLRISSIMLFLGAVTGAQGGALAGFEAFRRIASVNLASGLAAFPLMVGGAYISGLNGALWGLVASYGVNCVLNQWAVRSEAARAGVPIALAGAHQELALLWAFSFPALLASMMVGPVNWVCSAILVNQPNGYAEMGILSAANQWFGALLFLPGVLGQVVLPALAERVGSSDAVNSTRLIKLSIMVNLAVVLPLVVAFSLASVWVMGLYGQSFKAGWPALVLVLVTAGLLAVQQPVGQMITAFGRMWLGFTMNMGWALIFVLLTFTWASRGAAGLAAARLFAYGAHAVWTFAWAGQAFRQAALDGSLQR